MERKQTEKKSVQSLRDLWDCPERSNILPVTRVPEEEEKKIEAKKILKEIVAGNFVDLTKDMILQIQEAEQTPKRIISPKKSTLRLIIVKLVRTKGKEKISHK